MLLAAALLAGCKPDPAPDDPGRVVLRRLNRSEYDNTVRDLFGTALRPARDFPADDFGLGFDNIGSVLSISPLHVELYDKAADELLDELFAFGTVPPERVTLEAESGVWEADNGNTWAVTSWVLWDEGALRTRIWTETAGDYTLAVEAFGAQAGDEPVRMALEVDGSPVGTFDVAATEAPERFEVRTPLARGAHELAVVYLNEYEALDADGLEDRNLMVDKVQLEGPLDLPRPPAPGRSLVLTCDPTADEAEGTNGAGGAEGAVGEAECAEQIARTFGRRAWRRPLTDHELAGVMSGYGLVRELGGSWEEGVRGLVKSLLLSPHFLYLVEVDPADGPRPLTGFELASRLSYFLWSSTPDDRLLDLAATGALTDPAVLEAEARRMLEDPRSDALVDNLAGQWLGIRKVDEAQPNPEVFPEWDSGLQASMRAEVEQFVRAVLRSDRPLLDLLLTEETFVDARLAEHYGVSAPAGEGLQPMIVPGRAGLLARGGLLAALSYPTRTSPVLRGNWVLGNLLCSPPPPPPGDIPPLEDVEATGPISVREQLEIHRANPACASCHDQMDAIGFALEEYDAIGRHREVDELGIPIDPTGSLEGLGAFDGAAEMQALVARDGRFARCAVDKTFTYALGRGPSAADDPVLAELTVELAADGYRFEELVLAVVRSEPFRWRNGDAP